MISKELLELLVCPENRMPLELADEDLVTRINNAIRAGSLKNRAGQPLSEPLSGALIRQDGALAYGIVDDIPIMLVDEAIPIDQLEADTKATD